MNKKIDRDEIVADILNSRKYRDLGIPRETILDIIDLEFDKWRGKKDLKKAVRQKLHNVVAVYLGDPHYDRSLMQLKKEIMTGEKTGMQEFCLAMLHAHASTKERIPIMETFYKRLFEFTGKPDCILDLACGLHPFSLPWMDLPGNMQYLAYDLHMPRINMINEYLQSINCQSRGIHQDILVNPPKHEAHTAFLFKEAHRMEKRNPGCSRLLWPKLRVKYLLVSLPTNNLTGRHSLEEKHRRLVTESIKGFNWKITEISFEDELVFCMETGYEPQKETTIN